MDVPNRDALRPSAPDKSGPGAAKHLRYYLGPRISREGTPHLPPSPWLGILSSSWEPAFTPIHGCFSSSSCSETTDGHEACHQGWAVSTQLRLVSIREKPPNIRVPQNSGGCAVGRQRLKTGAHKKVLTALTEGLRESKSR